MKKLLVFMTVITMLLGISLQAFAIDDESIYKNTELEGTTLNVYNWGEYISDGSEGSLNINKKFEELTGIKVNYTNYQSNEDLYAKLKSGGANYDVIIPSDYMIQRLIKEKMLSKIDFNNVPNYGYIDSKYKSLYFDKNNEYSVPYAVGMVGLIYNTKIVKEKPTSWSIMWDKKYKGKILNFNNPRDAFAIAQLLLGQNLNTTNNDDWQAALKKLEEQKPLIKSYVMDDVFNLMENGSAAMAPYYAGDYLTMKENNPDLAFVYPKEGSNIFVDSMCIPSNCQNKKAAELYINFLLEPDIALANAEYIQYASPNTAVTENDNYSLKDNEILYPDEKTEENAQYFENLPQKKLTLMSDLWDELKVDETSNTILYAGIAAVVVLAAAFSAIRVIKKKKREKEIDSE